MCIFLYFSFTQIYDDGIIGIDNVIRNSHIPRSLPHSGLRIVAPYWADVDTRRTGNIYYRQTTDPSLLARATSEIRTAFPESGNVTISNLLIATWDSVGYYFQGSDKVSIKACQ